MSIFNFRRKIINVRNFKPNIDKSEKMDSSLTFEERLINATNKFFLKSGSWSAEEFTYFRNFLIGNLKNNF